jgi:hypothetical protein
MAAERPMIVQDPNVPQVSKNIYKRKMDQLAGLSNAMVLLRTPLTTDEQRAMDYLNMVNAGERPKNLFKPGMDYWTYWVYLSRAEASKVKTDIMTQLSNAMMEKGMNKPQEIG